MTTSPPRLVVVDDDSALAEELAGLFTDVGYEVAGVASGAEEGIELVGCSQPDVVVMDFRMEGMTGTEAAEVLHREHPEVGVVLLSAYADESIVQAAMAAKVAAYLVKGCPAVELLATVENVAMQRRAASGRGTGLS
ncbi:MAG: response regulator [Actinomycetota bacterium]|nr:response regulator [Actinomycetota bacterium]